MGLQLIQYAAINLSFNSVKFLLNIGADPAAYNLLYGHDPL